jgi:hypothetical protein
MKTQSTKQNLWPSNNDDDTPKYHGSFLGKLYALLEDAEEYGNQDIVSWTDDGNGFSIHKRDTFCEKMTNLYFKQTKFTSFTRQVCDPHHVTEASLFVFVILLRNQHLIYL